VANRARLAILSRVIWGGAVSEGPRGCAGVALTFDDGPDPAATPDILDALERARARATFFLLGSAIEREPELARRVAERHEVGTHLYSHSRAACRTLEGFDEELARALTVHERVLGARPASLRFPYGDRGVVRYADVRRRGLVPYHWSFSSEDSSAASPDAIVRHVVPRLYPGAIVLLHDGRGPTSTKGDGTRAHTVAALPRLLEALRERGLRAVTLSEMFGL
jgi:peptidoglycan/xylan/chitin deacetylase (PgdA/CDA1 family)